MPLRPVRRLDDADDIANFDCSEPVLNEWLREFALSDQRAGTSVTYVLCRDDVVIGFYTVAPFTVDPTDAPDSRLTAGQPSARPVPVLLLARLGLAVSEHGHRLGGDLLRDAIVRCAAGAELIGGRAVLVHAKHEKAASFYRHHGFVELPQNAMHLYRLMKDIRASIAASA